MLCVMSASAIDVTFNGKAVADGSTITVGPDAFEIIEKIPGKLYAVEAKSEVLINGVGKMSLTATSETSLITICQLAHDGGNCFTLNGNAAPYSLSIPEFTGGVMIDLSFNRTNVVPQEINAVDVTVKDISGEFKFKFVYDTTQAGIGDITTDGVSGYTVYSITGVKLLETENVADLNNLPAGLYIINGSKVAIK